MKLEAANPHLDADSRSWTELDLCATAPKTSIGTDRLWLGGQRDFKRTHTCVRQMCSALTHVARAAELDGNPHNMRLAPFARS